MDNEFEFYTTSEQQEGTRTYPIREALLTHKQLTNKIRINHRKLPSKFFANLRSLPELGEQRSRDQRPVLGELSSQRGCRSLKDYISEKKAKNIKPQTKQCDLGMTFSKLPHKKVPPSKLEQLQMIYSKRVSTQPTISSEQDEIAKTLRIECSLLSWRGINVRRNNHPIATLRSLKRNQ